MANSMVHWNGNHMAVFDTETSGLDANYHEILQMAAVACDSNFKVRKDVLPFYIKMKPEYPERADPAALRHNGLKLDDLMENGIDKVEAIDMFEDWWRKLDIPYNKSGYNQCKLIPLGQNYAAFDKAFIEKWLGTLTYQELIFYQPRDTMIAANFINDCHAFNAEDAPFHKQNLAWLCKQLGVKNAQAHDALQDCLATLEVYRMMITKARIFI